MAVKESVATREAYGRTLVALGRENPDIVVLDNIATILFSIDGELGYPGFPFFEF